MNLVALLFISASATHHASASEIRVSTLSAEYIWQEESLSKQDAIQRITGLEQDFSWFFFICEDGSIQKGDRLSCENSPYQMVSKTKGKVLTASHDRTAKLWDVESGECVKTFEGHENGVNSAVFSADSTQVLTASSDRTAKLWNVESGECVKTFVGHRNSVNSAVFSADSTQVLTASYDYTVKLWNVESGECVKTFAGHEDDVKSAVFSADSTQVLTA